MFPFVLLVVLPALMLIARKLTRHDDNNRSNGVLFVFFFMLTMLVILRHETIGNDTRHYIYYFKIISNTNWNSLANSGLEIGFVIYNKLIACISREPRFFLCITGILTSAIIFREYKRQNTDTALTIILFCNLSIFIMMFSGMRQMLAICMGLLAYECTRKKKLLLFLCFATVACTIHTSAFMLYFMYPLYYLKIKRSSLILIVPTFLIVLYFNKPIFGFLGSILGQYTKYEATVSSTGAYSMIVLLALFLIFSFVIPGNKKIDEETNGLRNFLLLASLIQCFAPINYLAMRMNYYYLIFIPVLIPRIIANCAPQNQKIAEVSRHIMVVFFFIFYFRIANGDHTLNTIPYHFLWESV